MQMSQDRHTHTHTNREQKANKRHARERPVKVSLTRPLWARTPPANLWYSYYWSQEKKNPRSKTPIHFSSCCKLLHNQTTSTYCVTETTIGQNSVPIATQGGWPSAWMGTFFPTWRERKPKPQARKRCLSIPAFFVVPS